MTRKSSYFAAFSYASLSRMDSGDDDVCPCGGRSRPASVRSTYGKSASHTATMFSPNCTSTFMFTIPIPPIPTHAMFSVRLGGR